MATNTQYLPWDNSTLSNFKSWAQGIGTALAAFGWTKSVTPAGTVNWSTIPYTPWFVNGMNTGTNQSFPQSILTLNFANAWSNIPLTLTSVATASGGTTVYTGTITGGAANGLAGTRFVIAGFTTGANNGTFQCTASTATTLTLNNTAGVAETHAATATFTYALNDLVTFNNATFINVSAYTTTLTGATGIAPPFEWIGGGTQHWVLYAFEVWTSGGTAPIFLRIVYSGAGNGSSVAQVSVVPRINITVGTTVDVNGSLGSGTGNTTASADLMPVANPPAAWNPGFRLPCFFSGDTNRFSMLMWPDLNTQAGANGSGFFCVERSMTNTGSYYSTMSGPAFVQGTNFVYPVGNVNTSGTATLTNTAGNMLIVLVTNGGTNAGTVSISDTKGNSYTPFYSDTTVNGQVQKAWFAPNIAAGSNTITVSWTTGATNGGIITAEYQGVATVSPLDQNPATKTGSGVFSTNSVTTTQAVELLIAVATNGTSLGAGPNAPFTQRQIGTQGATTFAAIMDTVAIATETVSASGGGSGNYAANIATFKASPNTPPITPYWTVIWWGNSGNAGGAGFIGSFIQTGPNSWITTSFDTRIWTVALSAAHIGPPDTNNEWFASGNGNQSIPAFPIWPLVGWVGNPMTAALSTKNQDAPAMGSFTALLYGTTHTYLNVRGSAAFQGFGNNSSGTPNGLAMRFD